MTWGDFVPDRAIDPPEADGWRAGDCPDCDGVDPSDDYYGED